MPYFSQDFGYGDYGFGDAASAAKAPITAASLMLSDTDTATGWQIVNQFYNYAALDPNFQLTNPIDILNYYMVNTPGPFDPNAFLQGVGLGAIAAGMSTSDTDAAMYAMAQAGNGQIPSNWASWSGYLSGQATNVTGWSSAVYAAEQTGAALVGGLQQVGTTLTNAGQIAINTAGIWSNLIYILPAVGLYWAYKKYWSKSMSDDFKPISAIKDRLGKINS